MLRRLLQILFVVVCVGLFGCSDYQRRWNTAAPAAAGRDAFEGSYFGSWDSAQYTGAKGKLWCILTRQSPQVYRADFRATWHGVFSSQHTVLLKVKERKRVRGREVVKFEGETEIKMWIGSGRYHCVGEMTPGQFRANYDAKYDRGTFTMARAGVRQ